METIFGLPYLDSLSKSLEIVKRDGLHLLDEHGDFTAKTQIICMSHEFRELDPDTCAQVLKSIECDKKVLREESKFIIKTNLMEARNLRVHPMDNIRSTQLTEKYKLAINRLAGETKYFLSPIFILFPDVEYNLKKEHPKWCTPFESQLNAYTNFKKEYNVDGIFGLLPAGKSYGGFVKAYFHVKMYQVLNYPDFTFEAENFQHMLGIHRVFYNSAVFTNEERLERFDKLGIKAEDCALWSRIFDKKFPGYKDLHKFFGQIA